MAAATTNDKVRTRLVKLADFPLPTAIFGVFLNPQPTRFGVVVSDSTGDLVVLGEEGQRVPGSGTVKAASLEVVTAPSNAVRDAWVNKIVLPFRSAGPPALLYSQEYTAKVVDVINVDDDPRLVCRALSSGMWFEIRLFVQEPLILGDR